MTKLSRSTTLIGLAVTIASATMPATAPYAFSQANQSPAGNKSQPVSTTALDEMLTTATKTPVPIISPTSRTITTVVKTTIANISLAGVTRKTINGAQAGWTSTALPTAPKTAMLFDPAPTELLALPSEESGSDTSGKASSGTTLKGGTPSATDAASGSGGGSGGGGRHGKRPGFHGVAEKPVLPKTPFPTTENGMFKVGIVETHTLSAADMRIFNSLKGASENVVYEAANKALKNGRFDLALQLFDGLCQKHGKDPRYFYGHALAARYSGDPYTAYSSFVIAWHLGGNTDPTYEAAANQCVEELKGVIDDQFRLTWGYGKEDPEVVINAGCRLWKAGLRKQSIRLFQYAVKQEPLVAHIAAFNLGCDAEYHGAYKVALNYYQWAARQGKMLYGEYDKRPELRGRITKSLKHVPIWYMEQAANDMTARLNGGTNNLTWRGWTEETVRPKHWCSEVCPICVISRTRSEYHGGEMEFSP